MARPRIVLAGAGTGRRGPEGPVGPAGAGADVTAAEIQAAKVAAEQAAVDAEAAKVAVEAVEATNDGIMASVAGDPESAFANTLSAAIAAETADPLAAKVDNTAVVRQELAIADAPALNRFWAACATADTARCDVLLIGHSFVAGVGSTAGVGQAIKGNRFATRVLTELRAQWTLARATGGEEYGNNDAYTRVTLAGGAGNNTSYGLGRTCTFMSGAGHSASYTFTGTEVDVIAPKFSGGGSFSWAVDGGSATTVSQANATLLAGQVVASVTGLSAGTHTITCTWVSGTVIIEGFKPYLDVADRSQGFHSWVSAKNSTTSAYFTDPAAPNWIGAVGTIQPDLVIIADVLNDADTTAAITPATSKANIQTLIANIRAKCTVSPSFVLVTEVEKGGVAISQPWADYVDAIKSIADTDPGVTVFDLGARFGLGPVPVGGTAFMDADRIHPNKAGHRFWATALVKAILPH